MLKRSAPHDSEDQAVKRNKLVKDPIFNSMLVYVLPTGIGKARSSIFNKQLASNGATVVNKYESDKEGLIIIVDDDLEVDRTLRVLKTTADQIVQSHQRLVRSVWVSRCLSEQRTLCISEFEVMLATPEDGAGSSGSTNPGAGATVSTNPGAGPTVSTNLGTGSGTVASNERVGVKLQARTDGGRFDDDSDYSGSDGEQSPSSLQTTSFETVSTNLKRGSWVCTKSSASDGRSTHHNKHITDKLEKMIEIYETSNDKWRVFSYQKAVAVLRKHPKSITTWEEAKSLPGIGSKLADKIWEIAESGELRKLDELRGTEACSTLKLFTDLWGAGPVTAQQWYAQGLRTLEDLRLHGNLNKQQQIGLKHYHDLLERMSRDEAARIESEVAAACHRLNPGLMVQACGSYRRGKSSCGDVDILVTHPDGRSHHGVFSALLQELHSTGFLTDDLTVAVDGNQQKYLGVCKLPGEGTKHRRLDIIVVPYEEHACALLYFTGSAHFNRSLRLLAKKSGMSLNEHALMVGVVRAGGDKVHRGTPVATPTEESIFKLFGIPYRPPEERDH